MCGYILVAAGLIFSIYGMNIYGKNYQLGRISIAIGFGFTIFEIFLRIILFLFVHDPPLKFAMILFRCWLN